MEADKNNHEANHLPWSLDRGTPQLQYAHDLAKLVLGRLSPERNEKVLEVSNGYVVKVPYIDSETGEATFRHGLTEGGMKVLELLAWPVMLREIKATNAERSGTDPEQLTLFWVS